MRFITMRRNNLSFKAMGFTRTAVVIFGSAVIWQGIPAEAQTAAPAATAYENPDSLRDPRVARDVPNISGVWVPQGYGRRVQPMDGSETPWQPWSKKVFDERAAAEEAGAPLFDPTAACLPSGNPRLIASPYPIEIIQTPDVLYLLHETHHMIRMVHMNKPMPSWESLKPTYMGYSVGHWEGDTLVIETAGLIRHTQVDEAGTPKTAAMKITERYRKTSPTAMEATFTLDDPGAFTKPWTAVRRWNQRPDVRLAEYTCEENNRNAPDENGVLRNF